MLKHEPINTRDQSIYWPIFGFYRYIGIGWFYQLW